MLAEQLMGLIRRGARVTQVSCERDDLATAAAGALCWATDRDHSDPRVTL